MVHQLAGRDEARRASYPSFESELAVRLQACSGGGEQGEQQVKHGGGELDPERGNVNDCALGGVLSRHASAPMDLRPKVPAPLWTQPHRVATPRLRERDRFLARRPARTMGRAASGRR